MRWLRRPFLFGDAGDDPVLLVASYAAVVFVLMAVYNGIQRRRRRAAEEQSSREEKVTVKELKPGESEDSDTESDSDSDSDSEDGGEDFFKKMEGSGLLTMRLINVKIEREKSKGKKEKSRKRAPSDPEEFEEELEERQGPGDEKFCLGVCHELAEAMDAEPGDFDVEALFWVCPHCLKRHLEQKKRREEAKQEEKEEAEEAKEPTEEEEVQVPMFPSWQLLEKHLHECTAADRGSGLEAPTPSRNKPGTAAVCCVRVYAQREKDLPASVAGRVGLCYKHRMEEVMARVRAEVEKRMEAKRAEEGVDGEEKKQGEEVNTEEKKGEEEEEEEEEEENKEAKERIAKTAAVLFHGPILQHLDPTFLHYKPPSSKPLNWRNVMWVGLAVGMLALLLWLKHSSEPFSAFDAFELDPPTHDFYSVLGLESTANNAAIKRAYRKLARDLHPDKNLDCEDCPAKFQELSEAYAVLSDPERRSTYDHINARYEPLPSDAVELNEANFKQLVMQDAFVSGDVWIVQIYSDWHDTCTSFSSVWEDVIHRTRAQGIETVHFGRVHIKHHSLLRSMPYSFGVVPTLVAVHRAQFVSSKVVFAASHRHGVAALLRLLHQVFPRVVSPVVDASSAALFLKNPLVEKEREHGLFSRVSHFIHCGLASGFGQAHDVCTERQHPRARVLLLTRGGLDDDQTIVTSPARFFRSFYLRALAHKFSSTTAFGVVHLSDDIEAQMLLGKLQQNEGIELRTVRSGSPSNKVLPALVWTTTTRDAVHSALVRRHVNRETLVNTVTNSVAQTLPQLDLRGVVNHCMKLPPRPDGHSDELSGRQSKHFCVLALQNCPDQHATFAIQETTLPQRWSDARGGANVLVATVDTEASGLRVLCPRSDESPVVIVDIANREIEHVRAVEGASEALQWAVHVEDELVVHLIRLARGQTAVERKKLELNELLSLHTQEVTGLLNPDSFARVADWITAALFLLVGGTVLKIGFKFGVFDCGKTSIIQGVVGLVILASLGEMGFFGS